MFEPDISQFITMLEPQEIKHAKELLRLEDKVKATLTEIDEINAAEAITRSISG